MSPGNSSAPTRSRGRSRWWFVLKQAVAPACLVLALGCTAAGFGLLALGDPGGGTALLEAQLQQDAETTRGLQGDVERSRQRHRLLVSGLFAAAIVLGGAGILGMSNPVFDHP